MTILLLQLGGPSLIVCHKALLCSLLLFKIPKKTHKIHTCQNHQSKICLEGLFVVLSGKGLSNFPIKVFTFEDQVLLNFRLQAILRSFTVNMLILFICFLRWQCLWVYTECSGPMSFIQDHLLGWMSAHSFPFILSCSRTQQSVTLLSPLLNHDVILKQSKAKLDLNFS